MLPPQNLNYVEQSFICRYPTSHMPHSGLGSQCMRGNGKGPTTYPNMSNALYLNLLFDWDLFQFWSAKDGCELMIFFVHQPGLHCPCKYICMADWKHISGCFAYRDTILPETLYIYGEASISGSG